MPRSAIGVSSRAALLCVLAVSATSAAAWAVPPNVTSVPNGGVASCATCHVSSSGGARTRFGQDFEVQGSFWSEALCRGDSDSDGFTNGDELGDPACLWLQGPAPRSVDITDPSDPDDVPTPGCGNLIVEPGEACDGFNLNGASCADFGAFVGGALDCRACVFELGGCREAPRCGDGRLDEGEACDGDVPGESSCALIAGFVSGSLRCTGTCALDLSACVAEPEDMGERVDLGRIADMEVADQGRLSSPELDAAQDLSGVDDGDAAAEKASDAGSDLHGASSEDDRPMPGSSDAHEERGCAHAPLSTPPRGASSSLIALSLTCWVWMRRRRGRLK